MCGTSCVPNSQRERYAVCNGNCQPIYKDCKGTLECPEGTLTCKRMIPDNDYDYGPVRKDASSAFCGDESWYKLCNGECIWKDQSCPSTTVRTTSGVTTKAPTLSPAQEILRKKNWMRKSGKLLN